MGSGLILDPGIRRPERESREMAGVARIVIGVILVVIGIPVLFLLFVGLIPIIIGVILIASGASARGDEQRMIAQQNQTNFLLQPQMQLTAMQANRPP
jgi:uncharacterized membrane protein HdeD (DUF308 family)